MAVILLVFILAFSLQGQGDLRFRPQGAFSGQTPRILWTDRIVPYAADSDIPNPSRFTDAVAYYNASTPLHFQPRGSEANYVHLVRSTVGDGICSSNVGMIGGEQFIHVEDTCTTATLIHEMGHTAGFFHEQSRYDRNLHITILYENINKSGYSDFNPGAPPLEQDVGVYDYASHMHYTPFEFSANTLPVLQSMPAGIPLDSYTVLSPGDLDTLFRMYGKPPALTTLVTNPPGLQMTVDGQTVTSPQTLNWAAGSKHTVGTAGQTPGSVRYSFARWSDGGDASHTLTADPSVTFYSLDFIQQVPVSAGVAASGGGTASLDIATPDGYIASQTVVTMTAAPAPGYTFLHWSGGSACPRVNAASPTTFVVGSTAINCLATFTQSPVAAIVTDPLNLPVTVDGVSYLQTPVNVVWTPGSTHTISTAPPASNPTLPARYIFQNWSDGGTASHTVTAGSAAVTIKASYKTQYNLVPPPASPAAFSVTPASPDGFYDAGAKLQVSAVPLPGWTFIQWTRDLAGQPNPAILTMDSQKAFGANLSQNPPALAIANSASLANTAVAPGEIVTIFRGPAGTNPIGPDNATAGQLDSSGKLSTSVGGTTVTLNGTPAPIVYTSAGQTSVVAPYNLAAQGSAGVPVQFQVQYNGKTTSSTAAVDVTAPGFFTAASTGAGQVVAVNQDGTVNSEANPALRGSIVTFYATGAGQLAPRGVDGAITALPLPVLTQPASIRIGGKPANLLYAGPAPSEVSGVLQLNAMVPLDAPPGKDSVYLVIGINSSPAGATVAVR